MSKPLPLATVDWEITLSESSVLIQMSPGDLLSKFHQCTELGELVLAASWVVADVQPSLENWLKQQID